jgi:large subunit ribosomal protein L9
MEVMLKTDVKGIGRAGQVINVSEGYARNFLFPSNKAVIATPGVIKELQAKLARNKEKVSDEEAHLRDLSGRLAGVEITIKKKAHDDGKLFGSVTEAEMADELSRQGYKVDKHDVVLEGHIKELGMKMVNLKFKYDIPAKIKLWVVKEK